MGPATHLPCSLVAETTTQLKLHKASRPPSQESRPRQDVRAEGSNSCQTLALEVGAVRLARPAEASLVQVSDASL